MYTESIIILVILGYLYFNQELLHKIIFHLLKIYTFIEINLINKIIKIQRYWNRGLKINKIYYYNNNRFIKKDIKNLDRYTKTLTDDEIIYILYKYDNINYVDIVNSSNGEDYDIENSLNLIKENNYKHLISACSITISNNNKIIYDEVDITRLFLRLLHNAINRRITIKSINNYMINNFNLSNNNRFELTIVDNNCNIYELNEKNSITITPTEKKNDTKMNYNLIKF